MATFEVHAYERFLVRTRYVVEADTKEDALQICKSGNASYQSCDIEDDPGEWVKTIILRQVPKRTK